MELVDQDMDRMLKSEVNSFTESHLLNIVYNTLCALAFLHEANVMHRDLKPENLLICNDCNVKITDFGLARTIA